MNKIAYLCTLISLALGLPASSATAASEPFRDPTLPLEQRLDDLIGRLTLAEKAILLNHQGPTIERLGIRSDQWNQCLNGVMWNRPTTLFPPLTEYDISQGFPYLYAKGAPLYAFGQGLSYTTFAYSGLNLSSSKIKADGTVTVSVEIANTGRRAGDEVAQLYVRDVASSVVRPVKELRGFQRLTLQPGEKRTIAFTLPAAKLAFWDEKTHAFLVEPGAFGIMVGDSSADIRARATLEVAP